MRPEQVSSVSYLWSWCGVTLSCDRPSWGLPIHPSDHGPSDALVCGTSSRGLWHCWFCQTQHFSEKLLIEVKCFCNLPGHQQKAFLFICHCWQKINKMLSVGIKCDAIPVLLSREGNPLPLVPCPCVRNVACVELDLFSFFPILCSFGTNFIFHSTFLK